MWGRRVGEGRIPGTYAARARGDGGTRLPWYGWQSSPTSPPRSVQPYYAYGESGRFTLVLTGAPRAVRLVEAGGYAPVGRAVGVVTVTNLRTGETGRTAPLGGGIARGPA